MLQASPTKDHHCDLIIHTPSHAVLGAQSNNIMGFTWLPLCAKWEHMQTSIEGVPSHAPWNIRGHYCSKLWANEGHSTGRGGSSTCSTRNPKSHKKCTCLSGLLILHIHNVHPSLEKKLEYLEYHVYKVALQLVDQSKDYHAMLVHLLTSLHEVMGKHNTLRANINHGRVNMDYNLPHYIFQPWHQWNEAYDAHGFHGVGNQWIASPRCNFYIWFGKGKTNYMQLINVPHVYLVLRYESLKIVQMWPYTSQTFMYYAILMPIFLWKYKSASYLSHLEVQKHYTYLLLVNKDGTWSFVALHWSRPRWKKLQSSCFPKLTSMRCIWPWYIDEWSCKHDDIMNAKTSYPRAKAYPHWKQCWRLR